MIHRTDTVSIAIACSESPVPLNLEGVAKLTSGLTRIEERLQRVVDEYIKHNLRSSQLSSTTLISKTPIPNHETWIITMWLLAKILLQDIQVKDLKFHGKRV